jgi:hypothetical protein
LSSRGVQAYLYSYFNLGAICEWGVNATLRSPHPRQRNPVPFVQEVGWAQVWAVLVCKISPPTGIRSPVRPGSAIKNTSDVKCEFLMSVIQFTSFQNKVLLSSSQRKRNTQSSGCKAGSYKIQRHSTKNKMLPPRKQ